MELETILIEKKINLFLNKKNNEFKYAPIIGTLYVVLAASKQLIIYDLRRNHCGYCQLKN